jgi:uncharacterized protein (DUF2126 family)
MIDEELAALDEALRARGLEIWIGAEPTFTRPEAQDPCWLYEAEGGDKEDRARALLVALAPRLSGSARLCRAVGRQFPGEPRPRFAFGAQWPRASEGGAGGPQPFNEGPVPAPAPDPTIAWMTVTPDPAVVEVNLPPAPDLATFARYTRAVYAAAAEAGLSPVRHRWNGDITDSGGGGQITLGGPTPEASPFFAHPGLLPGLLRMCNRHPSLSYWFAPDCVGSASQGPRPDEGVRERFTELGVALDRLDGAGGATREELWESLAPLLVDCSGNSHRAEVNVEKLWSPHLAERGRLGLVELRALRMEPDAERMIAVGALFRALAARLAVDRYTAPLVDWGATLHDLWALPWFLRRDLEAILDEVAAYGFVLGPALRARLLAPPAPIVGGGRGEDLTITPAREFWPLVGDVASQERRGARVVDSSTVHLEIVVRGAAPGKLTANGREVPMFLVDPGVYLAGLRYRAYVPRPGFHPNLAAHDPLELCFARDMRARRVTLHPWIPGGGVYSNLPDATEAARRRAERVQIHEERSDDDEPGDAVFQGCYTIDLRRP